MWASIETSEASVSGFDIFRQFTVWSNLLIIFPTLLIVSHQIDGLLHDNYHLPKWLVLLQYTATVCLVVTFIISLTVGSSVKGFMNALWSRSKRYLHLLVPCFALLLFIFQNFEVKLSFRHAFAAIIPVVIYSIVYLILTVFIGEHNGGWDDFYHVASIMPWYWGLCVLLFSAILISVLLRLAHNAWAKMIEKLVLRSAIEDKSRTIEEAIAILAMHDSVGGAKNDNLSLPVEVFELLKKRYHSKLSTKEMCKLYIDSYLP